MFTSEKIKSQFISYFVEKGYHKFDSNDLIPDIQDNTLLFTNSVMSRYKKEFSGQKQVSIDRVVTHQRCLRIGGQPTLAKERHHIESIGDGQSLSLFEQLGICCFDIKSKKEIISLVFGFFVEALSLPIKNFLVTVDENDTEVINIWKDFGIPDESIIRLQKLQWRQFDDLSICGYCTHFIYDRVKSINEPCNNPSCDYNCKCGRFLDLGDIVFFEYSIVNREFIKNSSINVDCGLGLERITMILEQCKSIFDISIFKPLLPLLESISKYNYNSDAVKDVAFKVILDHTRTITIAIGDNILPGKSKREHVVRKLIRHAIRAGWILEIQETFLYRLVEKMVAVLSDFDSYRYIARFNTIIVDTVHREEVLFSQILNKGTKQFGKLLVNNNKSLSGDQIFILYDRYGLPLDFINIIAKKNNIDLFFDDFYVLLNKHKGT